jgi:hypothetical protein
MALFIPPAASGSSMTAKVPGFETDSLSLVGATPNEIDVAPKDFDQGRFFTDEENNRGARVAVLGFDLAKVLYPDGNAVGKTLIVDGAEFYVDGVYSKAKGGFFGQNGADTQMTIPLKTAEDRYPNIQRYMITAKAKPGMRKDAFDEVDDIMRKARRLKRDDPDDFAISTPDQIIQQFDKITGLIGLIAIAISALGLLVGGIGVMNIRGNPRPQTGAPRHSAGASLSGAEIQELADFVGDSLELARKAREAEGDVIAFCGVWFMAETAKVLNPSRTVVVPDKDASCSLVEGCPVEPVREYRRRNPDHVIVSYINTSSRSRPSRISSALRATP